MNQTKPVCVLLVEADATDAQRIQVCLRQFAEMPLEVLRAGNSQEEPKKTVDSRSRDMRFELTWVKSLAEALQKIAEFHFDILIVSLILPDSQDLSVIRSIRRAVNNIPMVVLIDRDDINFAQTTLKAGANDYIIKNDVGYESLVRVMRYVLHRADMEVRNQLLVAALEATSNAIIITDRDTRIEWINPAFTQLTGYTFREALGRRPIDLLKSDEHDQCLYTHMWEKLTNGEHWQGEIINKHKDGSLYNADVGISPVRNKLGSLSGYVQIHRDITDSMIRLAISEVLHQYSSIKERFRQVLDIFFNLKAFDLHRKGGVFLKDKNNNQLNLFVLRGVFSPEFIEKEQCIDCGSCLCGQVAISGELVVSDDCFCDLRHEHQYPDMPVHGHYIVPITSGSEVLGVMFLYTDPKPLQSESRLSMLKQVGEMMALALRQEEAKTALETARDMAMQASLIKSQFLANMSHEIRTPMNGVLGMLDLLRETKMTPTQLDWIETAHRSAESLLEIINAILDFSKLEAGKFEIEKVDFNIIDLVDDICALLAGRAHAKGLELNCLLPVAMPLRWRGDPMRIRQVLTNLIGNAVKFTERGEVSVKLINLTDTEGNNELRFEVHDTGIGISSDAQSRLFKPFSQAESATSRRFGGSGLGLSISKELVKIMGGNIGVDSVVGVGSCFWFTLPLEQSECTETSRHSYDLSGKRTLVVDDNATNRNILANYLSSWGLEVTEAENGSTALMILQTSAIQGLIYDLILLDMQMPIMDGLTVAKCLAHVPALAEIPIILLSSGDLFELADYQDTRIVQRLLKPVRQLQLFDAIANALQNIVEKPVISEQPEIELPNFHDKKVLVVEDNKINQKVIIAKLAKFDIYPDLAENGQMALEKLAQNTYDLILMDCQMPIMDGYMATRELRLLEIKNKQPHQVVIALTANALEGEREKCLASGMDNYLAKPIISQQLVEMLEYYLGDETIEKSLIFKNEDHFSIELPKLIWDESKALKQLDGDKDLLTDMINLFLIEAPKQLIELSRVQTQNDLSSIAHIAHNIKGTIAHFCAEEAKSCAIKLEQAARNEQFEDIHKLTEALVNAISDLINQLLRTKSANKLPI